MRTSTNLNQTAQGASCSTANTRQRVTSIRKSRTGQSQSVRTTPKPLYQITMNLVATSRDANGYIRSCSVINTDIYQAASETEAIGIAVSVVRTKYASFFDLDMRSISVNRTYNIPNI